MVARRFALLLAGVAVALGLALLAGTLWITRPAQLQGTALIGGPFTLIDQNGRTVTADDFKGEPFVVFFGYTHCPDVCPTTLSDLSQTLDALGKTTKVRAAFITVDPERDTPAVMKDYLSSFDPRIVGLTGSPAAVAAAEKAYRVYAKKVPMSGGSYSMDHTAVVYLMDSSGQFSQALNLEQPPEKSAADIRGAVM